jgi:mannose-6-phosphate isomerase
MVDPYPLVFESILKTKVWGGRRLERYGKSLPPDPSSAVGESWELADLATTSVSGGGGDAAISVITNGSLAGQSIRDVMRLWGPHLLGRDAWAHQCKMQGTAEPGFPLLLKFLDAREHLSVQVHPSPAYAAAHPDAHLKTESWYVLDAEPMNGAEPLIFCGLVDHATRESFLEHLEQGTVRDLLRALPANPGHCYTLPSGTVHALGAGVLVAEVQTASDTTFRVYDWTAEYSRPLRELHLEPALACIDFADSAPPEPTSADAGAVSTRLATTAFYTIDEVAPPASGLRLVGDHCVAVMGIAGRGRLESAAGTFDPVGFAAGTTVLVPAIIAADARLIGEEDCRALIVGLDPLPE